MAEIANAARIEIAQSAMRRKEVGGDGVGEAEGETPRELAVVEQGLEPGRASEMSVKQERYDQGPFFSAAKVAQPTSTLCQTKSAARPPKNEATSALAQPASSRNTRR